MLALSALALTGCRDALDGDACLAVCERRITCGKLAAAERASCERACENWGACDSEAADACAWCVTEAECDDLGKDCDTACADPCAPAAGGSGGGGGEGGSGGGGGTGGAPPAGS